MVEPDGRLPFANMPVAHKRRGSLVIECVIAAALIATATLALTRLAHQTTKLNHQADNRLAAKLVAENFLERTRESDAEQLEEDATALEETMAKQYGSKITVETARFESGDRQGTHLQIEVSTAPNARVKIHDWRLIQADKENAEPGVSDQDASDDEVADDEAADDEAADDEAADDEVAEKKEDDNSGDEPAPETTSNDESSSSKENEAENNSASGGSDDEAQ